VLSRARESTQPLSPPSPLLRQSLSITIRARGSGSAGGVGGGTTGGSSINSGGSSPHALHSTTAATAATFPNSMGDWEELKRKVRGIESKLEVRSDWARPEPRVEIYGCDPWGLACVVVESERECGWLKSVVGGETKPCTRME